MISSRLLPERPDPFDGVAVVVACVCCEDEAIGVDADELAVPVAAVVPKSINALNGTWKIVS